jgi:hypothetical protein
LVSAFRIYESFTGFQLIQKETIAEAGKDLEVNSGSDADEEGNDDVDDDADGSRSESSYGSSSCCSSIENRDRDECSSDQRTNSPKVDIIG